MAFETVKNGSLNSSNTSPTPLPTSSLEEVLFQSNGEQAKPNQVGGNDTYQPNQVEAESTKKLNSVYSEINSLLKDEGIKKLLEKKDFKQELAKANISKPEDLFKILNKYAEDSSKQNVAKLMKLMVEHSNEIPSEGMVRALYQDQVRSLSKSFGALNLDFNSNPYQKIIAIKAEDSEAYIPSDISWLDDPNLLDDLSKAKKMETPESAVSQSKPDTMLPRALLATTTVSLGVAAAAVGASLPVTAPVALAAGAVCLAAPLIWEGVQGIAGGIVSAVGYPLAGVLGGEKGIQFMNDTVGKWTADRFTSIPRTYGNLWQGFGELFNGTQS